MTVRSEIRLGIGVFLVLILIVAFAGIALLERMSPAIARILQENVYSLDSAETMLVVLSKHPGAIPPADRTRYQVALKRAHNNITHQAERPLLARLARLSQRTLAGDQASRRSSIRAIRELAGVNRTEMQRADRRAQQVGTAGAWAMVVLGALGVLLSVLVFRRLVSRLLQPLGEIDRTLRAAAAGDVHRRTHLGQAPEDFLRLGADLNAVLDRNRGSGRDIGARPSR
jgi:methyl-accepting chemotaxis protein